MIDVRSEIEFAEGHVPGSINIPILRTDERVLVGTCYKQYGRAAAIHLGETIVSGAKKSERIQNWIRAHRESNIGIITCFRGGLRSQFAQAWCEEAGVSLQRIEGGTKSLRTFLMQQLEVYCHKLPFLVIAGNTGCGKSSVLRDLTPYRLGLDLEALAHHRGSVFGGHLETQPSQISFENHIGCALIQLRNQDMAADPSTGVLIEDESRTIGKCILPTPLFDKMRSSAAVIVDESLDVRTQNTFNEYVLGSRSRAGDIESGQSVFRGFRDAVVKISRKLGGARTSEVLDDLNQAEKCFETHQDLEPNKVWIRKLLAWYYDPLYNDSFQRRNVRVVFRGSRQEVFDWGVLPAWHT